MLVILPWIVVTALALAVVLAVEWRQRKALAVPARRSPDRPTDRVALEVVPKAIASLGFIGAALALGALDTFYGQTLLLALAWGFIGDVLLALRGSRLAFLFGIVAFLFGHLGYVMVFRLRGTDPQAIWISLGVLAVIGLGVWRWLAPHLSPRPGPRGGPGVGPGMRGAVVAYIAVISLMVAFAVGTFALRPSAVPLIGATMFWVSDLTVARQRFVRPSFWNRAVGLPLYYAAQFVLVGLLTEL